MNGDLKVTFHMKEEGLRLMNLDMFPNIKMPLGDWKYPTTMSDIEANVKSYLNVVAGFEPWTNRELDMYSEFLIWRMIVEYWFNR